MKRFLSLFVQDLKISVRNALILFLVAVMVVMVTVVAFVIPEESTEEESLLVADLTEGGLYAEALRQEGGQLTFFEDEATMLTFLEESPNTIAMLIVGKPGDPAVTVFHHGLMNPHSEALMTQLDRKSVV